MIIQHYVERRVKALHAVLSAANRKTLVVGVSGGVDSAVVLSLLNALQLAYPGTYNVVPVIAPIYSSKGTTGQTEATDLGYEVCSHFDNQPQEYSLSNLSDATRSTLRIETDYVQQQLDYWLRPMAFYKVAMEHENSILISTTNFSEWSLGWFSQYLDIFGIHPIIDLYKSEVYKLAEYFGIPESVVNTPPKGGLASGNTDEEALGFTYEQYEQYRSGSLSPEITSLIKERIDSSEFKRFRFNRAFIFQLNNY